MIEIKGRLTMFDGQIGITGGTMDGQPVSGPLGELFNKQGFWLDTHDFNVTITVTPKDTQK